MIGVKQALFYEPAIAISVANLVRDLDVSQQHRLDLEPGQPLVREQGVPFLRGADEIVINDATFEVEAATRTTSVQPIKGTTSDHGDVITFADDARLVRITVDVDREFDEAETNDGTVDRLIVRPAVRDNSGYTGGPPVYAMPPFRGGMFGPSMGGMHVEGPLLTRRSGGQKKIVFPAVAGRAFLVQVAKGAQPTQLASQAVAVNITSVDIETVPKDLSIELEAGGTTMLVFHHPGELLPGTKQTVTFRPMAEKLLNERLAAAPPGAPPQTLAVSLRFTSATAAALLITAPSLDAIYRARPSGQPRRVELRGGVERVPIDAPAGREPHTTSLTVAAKFLGRELNRAYEAGSETVAPSGLRVQTARSVAALVPFLPLAGSPEGSTLAVASIRLALAAAADSELSVELCADAGAPGAPLASHEVRQFDAAFSGWAEVLLSTPISVNTGAGAFWIVLRVTKGEVLWLCDRAETIPVLVTSDGGGTWGRPASLLAGALSPRVQLFHAVTTPETITIELGETSRWTLTRTGPDSVQFTDDAASLPNAVRTQLTSALAAGDVRATTDLRLFSRSAIDLTLDALTLSYRPYRG